MHTYKNKCTQQPKRDSFVYNNQPENGVKVHANMKTQMQLNYHPNMAIQASLTNRHHHLWAEHILPIDKSTFKGWLCGRHS